MTSQVGAYIFDADSSQADWSTLLKMRFHAETIGWLETVELVDSSGAIVRKARFFAYPKKTTSAFPSHVRSQCLAFVGQAIRMNGDLPEGIFVREKYCEFSRVAKLAQLERLTTYYETSEWRCVRA
ncbi:MAG: hypothetical protein WBL40_18225 [Terrimicrobiaceae bacterium]